MCAVGAALTDLQMDFVASGRWVLDDSAAVKTTFEELGERARAWLAEQGLSEDEARFFRTADMRYTGQSYELTVDMDTGALSANEFHRRYRDVYGYSDEGTPLEVLQLRLLVQVPSRALERGVPGPTSKSPPEPVERRSVTYRGGKVSVPVYRREQLPEGVRLHGPAVLLHYDTTTFVTPDFEFWREPVSGNVRGEMRG